MKTSEPKTCHYCQKTFIPKKRNDAKTCSAQCRKALSRLNQKTPAKTLQDWLS